jgi:hypothetical protein
MTEEQISWKIAHLQIRFDDDFAKAVSELELGKELELKYDFPIKSDDWKEFSDDDRNHCIRNVRNKLFSDIFNENAYQENDEIKFGSFDRYGRRESIVPDMTCARIIRDTIKLVTGHSTKVRYWGYEGNTDGVVILFESGYAIYISIGDGFFDNIIESTNDFLKYAVSMVYLIEDCVDYYPIVFTYASYANGCGIACLFEDYAGCIIGNYNLNSGCIGNKLLKKNCVNGDTPVKVIGRIVDADQSEYPTNDTNKNKHADWVDALVCDLVKKREDVKAKCLSNIKNMNAKSTDYDDVADAIHGKYIELENAFKKSVGDLGVYKNDDFKYNIPFTYEEWTNMDYEDRYVCLRDVRNILFSDLFNARSYLYRHSSAGDIKFGSLDRCGRDINGIADFMCARVIRDTIKAMCGYSTRVRYWGEHNHTKRVVVLFENGFVLYVTVGEIISSTNAFLEYITNIVFEYRKRGLCRGDFGYVKYYDNLENNKRKYLPVCHTTDDLLQFDSGFKPEYVDWNTFDEFEYPNREGYVRAKDVDARIDDLMKNKKC